jgi:hypothetical protein
MTAKLSPKEGALTWNERRSKKDRAGSMIYMARSGKRWSQAAGRRRHGAGNELQLLSHTR